MNTTDKPRSDSKLKTLPEGRQEEIFEFSRDHSHTETAKWLTDSGEETSPSMVCRFLSWYRAKQQLARNQATVAALLTDLGQEDPTLTASRLHEIGHLFFAGMALEQQDANTWYMAQKVALRRAQLQLDTDKHHDHLQAQKEAIHRELEVAKSTGGITPETIKKIEQELNLC